MKTFFFFTLTFILASCCLGSRKCRQNYNSSRFRLIDKINGKDLVFGSTRTYDKNFITFYSLNGTDTIFHGYGAGPNSNLGQDSLLYVNFSFEKKDTVFVRLNNSDIDTLILTYRIVDASPCCQDYTEVKPIIYNNTFLDQRSVGVTIIKK